MADNRKTVLILETMPPIGRAILEARADIRLLPVPLSITRTQMLERLAAEPRVDAMILGMQPIAAPEITAAKTLAVVARSGVGYDAIDVPALSAAKIPLMITGTANSPSVAEQALYFMLAFAKKGAAMDGLVKSGRWMERFKDLPTDLFGKTVLVMGFGRIGSRVVRRCLANEMTVLVHDPAVPAATITASGATAVADWRAALPQADYVTLHCPKTPATTGLIGAKELAAMKRSAILVNTARGGIVDEAALASALTRGLIAGAGLDVLLEEPAPADHPLLKFPNVLTAPHIAGVTKEAFDRMAIQAAHNVLSVFDGRIVTDNVVNADVLA
jgi:D-3-phosphoglycerate dehydrogenase / 2-oxoglutarate reductase